VFVDVLQFSATVPTEVTVSIVVTAPCPEGTYSAASGTNKEGCIPCPIGYYAASTGSAACTACPSALPVTLATGAVSPAECGAASGYVLVPATGSVQQCQEITGANCTEPGLTLESLPLLPGYWRPANWSLQVGACPTPAYCVGGAFEPSASPTVGSNSTAATSGRLLDAVVDALDLNWTGLPSDVLCYPHHTGVYCATCQPGYIKRGAENFCSTCDAADLESDQLRIAGIIIGVALGLALVFAFAACRLVKSAAQDAHDDAVLAGKQDHSDAADVQRIDNEILDHLLCAGVVWDKVKIAVSFFQVTQAMAVQFALDLPQDFYDNVASVLNILALDVTEVFQFGCVLPQQNFYTSLIVTTVLPVALILLVLAGRGALELAMRRPRWARKLRKVHRHSRVVTYTLVLFVLFFTYPSVSHGILETFACTTFDGGATVLNADPSVSCTDAEYAAYSAYAAVMTLVWIVGVPLLYTVLLYRSHKQLDPKIANPDINESTAVEMRDRDESVRHLRFLYRPYGGCRMGWWCAPGAAAGRD